MSLFASDNSGNSIAISTIELRPAPAVDPLAALSPDEPLPELAPRDEAHLLVQSPYTLFLYWNHARDPFETLRKALGDAAAHYRPGARLVDVESGEEDTHPASPGRAHWYTVRPGAAYRADIGFYAEDYPFVRLLSSEIASTPPIGVSQLSATEADFHVAAPDFARVLNEAGFASDALEVALEGLDEAGAARGATQTIAQALAGGQTATAIGDEDLAGLRYLISALAFGEEFERVRARLSTNLVAWLEALTTERGVALEPARLLELLRETLGFELEYEDEDALSALSFRPFLLPASSSAWGGSDVHQPQRRAHVWLPSMTAGRLPSGPARQSLGGASNWIPSMTSGVSHVWSPSMTGGAARDWLPSMSVSSRPPMLRWRWL